MAHVTATERWVAVTHGWLRREAGWHHHRVLTVGFLHTDAGRADFFHRWLVERAPDVVGVHLLDEALLAHVLQRGVDDDLRRRVGSRLGELAGRAVDAVVCTCSVLADEAARASRHAGIPTMHAAELAGERRALAP